MKKPNVIQIFYKAPEAFHPILIKTEASAVLYNNSLSTAGIGVKATSIQIEFTLESKHDIEKAIKMLYNLEPCFT